MRVVRPEFRPAPGLDTDAMASRQYPTPETRHINPLYVSPGHRVSAGTAADLVEATCTQYKLPAPTRLADQYAADLT